MKVFYILFFCIVFLFAVNLKEANKYYMKKQYKKAFQLYKKLGNIAALNNLAMMYYYGKGIEPDQAKAINILENLLKKKLTNKQKSIILYNLARMYYNGYINTFTHKLFIDRDKAKRLLEKSIKLGYKPAKIFYDKIYK